MAVKTFRLGPGNDGNYGALFEADQTAASRTDGWTVAKVAASSGVSVSDFDAGVKQISSTFGGGTIKPQTNLIASGSTSNCLKTPTAITATFAATNWTFTFAVRATTASAQAGRMKLRIWKDTDANATFGGTQLTTSALVGTTSSALSTTADVTTVVTWSPGTTITLTNEYLFFSIAWEITTASGNNSGDVVMRTGQSAGGTRIVTPDVPAGITYTKAGYAKESA